MLLNILKTFNGALFYVFTILYLYQMIYTVVGLLVKSKTPPKPSKLHRFAVMIAARNEEVVIGNLIDSIKNQSYPEELVDIYVIADNCTDNTASVSREHGANVIERHNLEVIGKGHAMDYAFSLMKKEGIRDNYDGFFIFDADNLLDSSYIAEMNKIFDMGYLAVTSYRNSKNFGDNWISAGYSTWFLREARYLNKPRMLFKTSCAISGTGFLISKEIVDKYDGWKFFLLTEDLEFNSNCAIENITIGYCENAVFYDEQPTKFRQSWNQRLRWVKGTYQVLTRYSWKLFKGMFSGKKFAKFDIFMSLAPGSLLTLLTVLVNVSCILATMLLEIRNPQLVISTAMQSITSTLTSFYLLFILMAILTMITEYKRIKLPFWKRIFYCFTFPLYVFTYIPIAVVALFKKVKWTPIRHNVNKSVKDLQ